MSTTISTDLFARIGDLIEQELGVSVAGVSGWEDAGTHIDEDGAVGMHRYVLVVMATDGPAEVRCIRAIEADARGLQAALLAVAEAYDEAVSGGSMEVDA